MAMYFCTIGLSFPHILLFASDLIKTMWNIGSMVFRCAPNFSMRQRQGPYFYVYFGIQTISQTCFCSIRDVGWTWEHL